jgi:peptide deformylase
VAHDHVHEHDDEHDDRAAVSQQEALLRRRVALAQIRQYGDPVLRMSAHGVESFDDDLGRLVGRMTALMHDADGVGLAATQVGVLQRVVVFVDDGADVTLVNPTIVERAPDLEVDEEGCLSLGQANVRVPVERNLRVKIEASDIAGEAVRLDVEGLSARVVQHELDHLDGVLIIDRTDPTSRRTALAELRPQPVLGAR